MTLTVLKYIFLMIAIMYTFTCIGRACRRQNVSSFQVFSMAAGIAGFCFLQFALEV